MPRPPSSSSPPLPRGEEDEGPGGCGDGKCSLQSAPDQQQQKQPIQNSSSSSGKKTEQPNIVDLDLLLLHHLSRFVAALPARWRSRQRVSGLGLALADLPECIAESGGADFPDCDEEDGEEEEDDDKSGPTLALLAFRGDHNDDETKKLLSLLGAVKAPAKFQVLAACLDERSAEELASRLRGGNGDGNRNWAWRPLSRSAEAGCSLLLVQLFRRRDDSFSSSSLLVASDYDHTLIDDNSDTLVVGVLGASETLEALWKKSRRKKSSEGEGKSGEEEEEEDFGWTEAVDAALRAGAAATARDPSGGRDPEEVVLSSAASASCHEALRRALLSVCGRRTGKSEAAGAAARRNDFAIFSDANDVFIEAGLRGNGLLGDEEDGDGENENCGLNLVAVATNPARFVDVPAADDDDECTTTKTPAHRRLALSRASERYRGGGGGGSAHCRICPANLCKGRLLARLVVAGPRAPYSRGVLYLGDGANDVCPAASCLGALDAALARERYGREGRRAAFGAAVLPPSPASAAASSSANPDAASSSLLLPKTRLLCRSVVPWSTQEELAEALVREAGERGGLL